MMKGPVYSLADDSEDDTKYFLDGFDRIESKHATQIIRYRRRRLLLVALGVLAVVCIASIIIALAVHAARERESDRPVLTYLCPGDTATYASTFFVIGDWGRRGNDGQRRAAKMMADVAGCMRPQFILSTGDNFYTEGLRSANDVQFRESFSDVYAAPSLQVPWYAVLGNHDYAAGGNMFQYTGVPRARDTRWHCQNGTYSLRDLGETVGGLMDIIMIDTVPLMGTKYSRKFLDPPGGIQSQNATAIVDQLDRRLKASTAPFKVVVGHHPVRSYGMHCGGANTGDCSPMQQQVDPVLRAGGAHAYICGHEHDLQHIQLDDAAAPHYVITGAGSDVRPGEFDALRGRAPDLKYGVDEQGFVAVRLTNQHAVMYFYASGAQLPSYTFRIPRS